MQNPLSRVGIVPLRANVHTFNHPEGVVICPHCGKQFAAKMLRIPQHPSDTGFTCIGKGMITEN